MAENEPSTHILIRLPPDLKRWAQEQAASNRRSQMVVWLEQLQAAEAEAEQAKAREDSADQSLTT